MNNQLEEIEEPKECPLPKPTIDQRPVGYSTNATVKCNEKTGEWVWSEPAPEA